MTQPASAPAESPALIALHGIHVAYNDRTVLSDIHMTITPGKIVTIIGPNGAGKSTLMRAMLGLVPITKGSIRRRTPLKVGYMPQHMNLPAILPMTVEAFMCLGFKRRQATMSIEGQLDEVQVLHLIDSPLQSLSGGELHRVMLARCLLQNPDLLVLDEPMQGVDVIGQQDFYQLLLRLRNRRQCAIVMVSHDLHLVFAASDEVICLNTHICCHGHPTVVADSAAFKELFGSSILVPYTHRHDHKHD